jgi:D-3-phosphoglycerate dehydrogenase
MLIVIADEMEGTVVNEIRKLGKVIYKPKDLPVALADADVLIVRSATKVTKELVSRAGKLKLVARGGVGLDNVDQDACRAKGIKVLNTPGASTNAVAELALALILASFRNVQKAHHLMLQGRWEKKGLSGHEIEGKTLGIIGYGRIGSALAAKAGRLGMSVIAYNPPPRHKDDNARFVGLDELLAKSDVISLHAALTQETKNIINQDTLAKMKNGVYLVNTARGELVDEDALYDACKSGKLLGAALDVYKTEPYKGKLLELENVYFTPHLGASTKEAQERIGAELVRILKDELKE